LNFKLGLQITGSLDNKNEPGRLLGYAFGIQPDDENIFENRSFSFSHLPSFLMVLALHIIFYPPWQETKSPRLRGIFGVKNLRLRPV